MIERTPAGLFPDFPGGAWPTPEGVSAWQTRVVRGTNPAAGAEISERVGPGRQWLLYAVRFRFVTDATVTTRVPGLQIDDGSDTFLEVPPALGQAATQTIDYTFAAGGASVSEANLRGISVLPFPLPLLRGYRIRTLTTNLQAGDDFGAPVLLVAELMDR